MTAQHVPPPGRPPLKFYERVLRDLALAGANLGFIENRFTCSRELSPAQEEILEDSRADVLALLGEHCEELMDLIREEERR